MKAAAVMRISCLNKADKTSAWLIKSVTGRTADLLVSTIDHTRQTDRQT